MKKLKIDSVIDALATITKSSGVPIVGNEVLVGLDAGEVNAVLHALRCVIDGGSLPDPMDKSARTAKWKIDLAARRRA